MSDFKLRKATRQQAKLRLALIGPAGAGKTYSALSIATNLVPGGRVAVIDTECGSAELYGKAFDFDTLDLTSHSPLTYVDAITHCEREGYDVIVIDSLSHAWMGKDGALDQVDKAADRDPRANSFTAWRSVTPKHNALVDKMVSCRSHLIVTIRAKTEFVQEKNEKTGRTEIRKIGLAPIQRDGLEYEFTLVGDIDLSNTLKISKTRLDGVVMPGDLFEKPGANLARKIYGWLMDGSTPTAKPAASVQPAPMTSAEIVEVATAVVESLIAPTSQLDAAVDDVFAAFLAGLRAATTSEELAAAAGRAGKPAPKTPEHDVATAVYKQQAKRIKQFASGDASAVA